ncbi:MAG: hypothetical protein LBK60_03065 [Verrucomicrobiales bacterium]|nr:hypothetical protein [Verrucomicrobiales bacterium]
MKKTSLYIDEKLLPRFKRLAKSRRQSASALLNLLIEKFVKGELTDLLKS